MKLSPKVAIVILNWNGKKFLEQFLPSVLSTTYDNYDLVIADNASTDDSTHFLSTQYPQLRVIQLEKNFGYAGGYNRALKEVDADYYVLLNSDVAIEAGWLQPMIHLLETQRGIAACQPKLLSFSNPELFEYAGAAGGWIDKYGYPFSKGRVFEICEEDKGQYDQSEPIFWASGAAFFVRSTVFHEVKGFDEYFFAHMEEIDLCWRIQLAGYKIYSSPSSRVYHVGGGTLPRGNSRKTYLNFRNNHIMLAKNLPFFRKVWIIPYRFCMDGVTAWKNLLSGDMGYFKAVIKAHLGFIQWAIFYKKRSVFPIRRTGHIYGILSKNLVWLHFVKRKRTFSEIVDKTL